MSAPLALLDAQRAELYQGLGRALAAGLSAEQALNALPGSFGGTVDARLARSMRAVRKGTALPLALHRQGLTGEADMVLLAAADHGGTLDRVCARLAERYRRSATRWRQMKGRLLLPAAVLVIAIVVLPLPAVAAGSLPVTAYLLRAAAMLTMLAGTALVLSHTVRTWRAEGTPGWLTRLARVLPGIGRLSRLHQRADACERLSLALASGLPAREALTAMRNSERNGVRRADLLAAESALGAGNGVADALERTGLLDAPDFAIVSTAEHAGRLEETLGRVATSCHDALDDAYTLLAQWIPVVLYLAVAAGVGIGLLG